MAYPYYNYTNPFAAQYQPQFVQPQPIQTGITWIGNQGEAEAYPLAPNCAVALWSRSEPVVYIKQSDATGRPTIKAYDITERSASSASHGATGADNLTQIASEIKVMQSALEGLRNDIKKLTEGKTDESDV